MSQDKHMMERIRRIVEEETGDQEGAARILCDEGLVVSMSQGRRLWHNIRNSRTTNGLCSEAGKRSSVRRRYEIGISNQNILSK